MYLLVPLTLSFTCSCYIDEKLLLLLPSFVLPLMFDGASGMRLVERLRARAPSWLPPMPLPP